MTGCLLSTIAGSLAVLAIIQLVLFIYCKLTLGKCKSKVKLHGKTAIITGANTGIGFETAINFAKRGAKLFLACRDPKRGQDAVDKVIKKTNNKNVFFKQLDLCSFKSVRKFADEFNKSEERLDILVNNAGALALPNRITEDGLLLMMQTNYFGPFLLTILLLNLMKKTSNARIVNVSSSSANCLWNFNVNSLNQFPQSGIFKDFRMYARTKLCNILFTIKLAEKLKGTSVTTYSLDPGAVITEIDRNYKLLSNKFNKIFSRCFMKNAREGAETTIYCSVAEDIEHLSGENFADCHVLKRYKMASDPELADKLWTLTEKLLKLN